MEKTLKLLQEANQRLKTGKVGLTLQLRGNKLSLQGQFPPKPNSERKDPHQQRLSLGLYGNPAGIQRAEAQAKRIAGDIACDKFRWQDYVESASPRPPIEQVKADFEKDYFARRGESKQSRTTWNTEYKEVFKKFTPGTPVTEEVLLNVILGTQANTRSRIRACMVCSAIAKFLNLEFDATRYRGNYSGKQVQPRDIPSDEVIAQHSLASARRLS